MVGDQLRARRFLSSCTPLHESGFASADIGPTGDSCLFHREFHYTKLDPIPARKFRFGDRIGP
jgi:hypothetical protein